MLLGDDQEGHKTSVMLHSLYVHVDTGIKLIWQINDMIHNVCGTSAVIRAHLTS